MTIVVVGPHGVGKSAVGRALADRLGLVFHGELGEELARARRGAEQTAAHPQAAFDAELFEQELARDAAWGPHRDRVVESWHPGNLAYAAARSPGLVPNLIPRINPVCRKTPVLVIALTASRRTLAQRQHEPGPLDFFIRVGSQASVWARRLHLHVLPAIVTDGRTLTQLTDRVVTQLHSVQEAS